MISYYVTWVIGNIHPYNDTKNILQEWYTEYDIWIWCRVMQSEMGQDDDNKSSMKVIQRQIWEGDDTENVASSWYRKCGIKINKQSSMIVIQQAMWPDDDTQNMAS